MIRHSMKMNPQRWAMALALYIGVFSVLFPASAAADLDITRPGDPIVGIPNSSSNWPAHESPPYVIDDNIGTKYLNFRGATQPSGFCVTPSGYSVAVVGLTVTTANDAPDRDPIAYELYGSNSSIDGPYTLIAAGEIVDFNQETTWPRYTPNATPIMFPNSTVYAHYQVLFTAIRNPAANSMQIAEVELIGSPDAGFPPIVKAGPDQIVVLPYAEMQLAGEVTLVGLVDPQTVQMEWTLQSAPEAVTLADLIFTPSRFTADPRVIFPAVPGMYVMSFTVSTENHTVSDTVRNYVSVSLCPAGDLNETCQVDLEDLLILAEFWLQEPGALIPLPDADGREDGVNVSDLAYLAENWLRTGPSAVISEFLAVNTAKFPLAAGEIVDEDGASSDWIELCNPTDRTIRLEGWYLTDNPTDLTQWQIPALTLEPEEFVVIFASGKDRNTPGEPYHTNFSIASAPAYLALVAPDGQTIVHDYSYPAQYGDVSYGLASPSGQPAENVELLSPGTPAVAKIPADSSLGLTWTAMDYEPVGWLTGTTGIGYERDTGFEPYIGLNAGAMYGVNTSIYIRVPFVVDDPNALSDLTLWMMYDDGFVAYLNDSIPAASANAPQVAEWNSRATQQHSDALAVQYAPFPLPDESIQTLRKGLNVLSIHGLNREAASTDFLILPKLTAVRRPDIAITSLVDAYFQSPTPGAKNQAGQMNLGPVVSEVTKNPVPPSDDENLVITARIEPGGRPIGQVEMVYRIGFGSETAMPMNDAGLDADVAAGDGVFSAAIPAAASAVGDMVRWAVRATDTQGIETRRPAILPTENTPRYYGTVVRDPSFLPPLQTLYYFVQDTASEATDTGTRCSVFFMDEFYDNVFIRDRGGNYTNGRKIVFNDGEQFLFNPRLERVDEINLNEQGADITLLRPSLSFETYADADVPGSIVFPLRVIRNNSDPVVRVFVEQPDRHLLRREGLDDNGAFYKVYSDLNASLSGEQVERKITRRDEDNSDLFALAGGIAPGNPARGVFLFDNVNIPAVISYLAVSVLVHENDHTHKNFFLYRDTDNTGEWMFIPWDKDLTFGLNHGIAGIAADQDWTGDPLRSPSHPFYGSYYHQKIDYKWNRLFDAVFADPTARQMYLRRLRTLMDSHLQPPATPAGQRRYEHRLDELVDLVAPELNSTNFQDAVNAIKTQYLPVRRTHLYVNHLHGSTWPDDPAGIPDAQPEQVTLQIGTVEVAPASGNRDEAYIQILNPNAFAADITGWRLAGDDVSHTFPGGTVIPAQSALYLTPNAIAFRNRAVSPRGGEYRFVQGNYDGQLSAWGGTLTLYDAAYRPAAQKTYTGAPTAAQRYVRITELMVNPSPITASPFETQAYEYIELTNIGASPLPLNGVTFTGGIDYAFPDGVSLAAGACLILAKNPAAFQTRYTVPQGVTVLGGYLGQLANDGESLTLRDAVGGIIHRFEYNNAWLPLTDGAGFSLTKHDPAAAPLSSWNEKLGWRASSDPDGSPGRSDPGLGIAPGSIVINEVLADSPGMPDWIELHNTTAGDISIGGWFLSDSSADDAARRQFQIPPTVLPAGGYGVFYEDTSFGDPEAAGVLQPFGLSRFGETVYLFSGQNGQITGHYFAGQSFDASQSGVSFGRHTTQDGRWDFTALSAMTPGESNADPLVGPVVIREIMYHPAPGGAYDKEDYEYIELRNTAGFAVPLGETDAGLGTAFPWKLRGGVDFDFPTDAVLPAGDVIVVAKNIDAFRSRYPAVPAGSIYGPYAGQLNNAGETIKLLRPGQDNDGVRAYLLIDRLAWSSGLNPLGQDPWPPQANGDGLSLHRISDSLYGSDPANWQALPPTPGQTPAGPVTQVLHYWHLNTRTGVLLSAATDYSLADNAMLTYPGTGDGYLDTTDGSAVNARFGQDPGNCLRVRNPSATRQLLLELPTTGYQDIRLSYATMRTSFGAQTQQIEYRASAAGAWQPFGQTLDVPENYTLVTLDFTGIPAAENNPEFAVRIRFAGSNAAAPTGNNRFDNIVLEGTPITAD